MAIHCQLAHQNSPGIRLRVHLPAIIIPNLRLLLLLFHLILDLLLNIQPIQTRNIRRVLHLDHSSPRVPLQPPKRDQKHSHSLETMNPALRQRKLQDNPVPTALIERLVQLTLDIRRLEAPDLRLETQSMSRHAASFRPHLQRDLQRVIVLALDVEQAGVAQVEVHGVLRRC